MSGLLLAVSGWLIRRRAGEAIPQRARVLHDGLWIGLAVVARGELSRAAIGRAGGRSAARDAWVLFHRSHVAAAVIAALGIPLGLAYGWFVEPRLEGVAPFWVVPMALGALAYPRRAEVIGLDETPELPPDPEAPGS